MGAPYSFPIPAGAVQVKCQYCGAIILVPPSLGGVVRQCLNHPETLAVGLCNDCGQSFCTRCLYVLNAQGGRLYVCAKCYENRTAKAKLRRCFPSSSRLYFLQLSRFLWLLQWLRQILVAYFESCFVRFFYWQFPLLDYL